MSYVFQTFSVAQVLTAAQMNQVEVSIRDHIHGARAVVKVPHAGLEGPYTVWHLVPNAVSSGTALNGLLRSQDSLLTVPTGLSLKIVRLEAFVRSPSTVGTYSALIRVFNSTDTVYTTVACMALTESQFNAVVVSATAASPVYSLGAAKKWSLGFLADKAPAAFAADLQGIIVTYTYE